MSSASVTVAIPVRNGSRFLLEILQAIRDQRLDRSLEILVADSGSSDGSTDIAARMGARVLPVAPGSFSHGGTRNLLMSRSGGDHVAFLTQDATPATTDWLQALLDGFRAADDVALTYGPYVPRHGSSPWVARELEDHFGALARRGDQVDRAAVGLVEGAGDLTFFTSANGCVSRAAWQRVPFREVPYAEDQMLARDMLAAGYAKVFCPRAGVLHSHDYSSAQYFRRCFDEWRGLREIHGHVESADPRRAARYIVTNTRADLGLMAARGTSGPQRLTGIVGSLLHHCVRVAGAIAGSRSDRMAPWLRRALSLEGRATFIRQPAAPPPPPDA